jgi:hypothetical protein
MLCSCSLGWCDFETRRTSCTEYLILRGCNRKRLLSTQTLFIINAYARQCMSSPKSKAPTALEILKTIKTILDQFSTCNYTCNQVPSTLITKSLISRAATPTMAMATPGKQFTPQTPSFPVSSVSVASIPASFNPCKSLECILLWLLIPNREARGIPLSLATPATDIALDSLVRFFVSFIYISHHVG